MRSCDVPRTHLCATLGIALLTIGGALPCVTAFMWADIPYQDPTAEMVQKEDAEFAAAGRALTVSSVIALGLIAAGIVVLAVAWRHSRRGWRGWPERADAAVARARTLLTAQSSAVGQVFHYGVTPLSTENLVVWVLLKGAEDDLPAWYFPGDSSTAQSGLLADLEALQAEVRRCFAAESWPHAGNVRVGFDSADRVASQGGWHYFK